MKLRTVRWKEDNLESFLLQNQSNLIIPFMTILQVLQACILGCVCECACVHPAKHTYVPALA